MPYRPSQAEITVKFKILFVHDRHHYGLAKIAFDINSISEIDLGDHLFVTQKKLSLCQVRKREILVISTLFLQMTPIIIR
jgi:hypothetical protein